MPSMRKIDGKRKLKRESKLNKSSNKNKMRLMIYLMMLRKAMTTVEMATPKKTMKKEKVKENKRAEIEVGCPLSRIHFYYNGVMLLKMSVNIQTLLNLLWA